MQRRNRKEVLAVGATMNDVIYNLAILPLKGKGKFHSLGRSPCLSERTVVWTLLVVRRLSFVAVKLRSASELPSRLWRKSDFQYWFMNRTRCHHIPTARSTCRMQLHAKFFEALAM